MAHEAMKPWSGRQIADAIGPELMKRGKILMYGDLEKYNTIDDLLPKPGTFAVIFVPVNNFQSTGHWIVLLRSQGDKIQHFCSFGLRPDRYLQWTAKNLRHKIDTEEPHLSDLLNGAVDKGYHVSFNEEAYQHKDTNTCGRWVAARVKHNAAHPNGDEKSFDKMVKKHLDKGEHPDEMIVKLIP